MDNTLNILVQSTSFVQQVERPRKTTIRQTLLHCQVQPFSKKNNKRPVGPEPLGNTG